MRLRTLKPGFFENEQLAALPPIARLLFARLWCYCDREGRCEDRPGKIKARVLPYDEFDIDGMLALLHEAGLIRRYETDGLQLICIPKFKQHQRPHIKEAESHLPGPTEHLPRKVRAPTKVVTSTNLDVLSLGSGEWGVGSGGLGVGDTTSLAPAAPVVGEQRKEPEKKQRRPPAGDHARVISFYSTEYAATQGTAYVVNGGKDGQAVKRLLRDFPVEEIEARAGRFLRADDEFLNQTDRSLSLFAQQFNRPCVRGTEIISANGHGKAPRALQALKDYVDRKNGVEP